MLESIKAILAYLKNPVFDPDSIKHVLDAVGDIYAGLTDILAFGTKQDESGLQEALDQLALQCKVAQTVPATSGTTIVALIVQLIPILLEFLKARK